MRSVSLINASVVTVAFIGYVCVRDLVYDAAAADTDSGSTLAPDAMMSTPMIPDASSPDADPGDLGPPPDARTCTAETCNGIDDDCDHVTDNGCPSRQVAYLDPRRATAIAGGGSTNVWTPAQSCPEGQVLVGFYG